MKPITLREVAAAANVHVTTASAVLNGSRGSTRFGQATREAVLQAARKLGYVRNEPASRLRTGASAAVGFIGGDLRNPFFAELVAAFEAELSRRNFQLTISHVAVEDRASFGKAVQLMRGQALHSVIYWDELGRKLPARLTNRLEMLPIGFTDRPRDGVWLDLAHAIRQSVRYFIDRGFRRLGFFAPSLRGESPSVQARWNLFVSECREHGLPEPVQAVFEGESWEIEAAASRARVLLKTSNPVQAYLSFNDIAALGLLLARRSRTKPEVLCFDGTSLVRSWPERPPYLDLPLCRLAELAVAAHMGDESGRALGRRGKWLRPEILSSAESMKGSRKMRDGGPSFS
jgi:LacI family transcriptional regulator